MLVRSYVRCVESRDVITLLQLTDGEARGSNVLNAIQAEQGESVVGITDAVAPRSIV